MVASSLKEHPENYREVPAFGLSLLSSAVLYGANASGKSNLLHAALFLGEFVRQGQVVRLPEETDDPPPFLLDPEFATNRADSPSISSPRACVTNITSPSAPAGSKKSG